MTIAPSAAPTPTSTTSERTIVRLWFGDHLLASYAAEPPLAARYAASITRRFPGIRVTTTSPPAADEAAADLPGEQLWSLTVL